MKHGLTPNVMISHALPGFSDLFPKQAGETWPSWYICHQNPHRYSGLVWPLEDNDRGAHAGCDAPITHAAARKVSRVTPAADELSRQHPDGIFCFHWVHTYETRHWSRAIIHGHYAKQWVLGDIWVKLTTEAGIIPLGIHFKVRKRGC